MGWEALGQWGEDFTLVEPLTGGVANQVWSVRVGGRLGVGRLGARSDADLAWETDLLRHLHHGGLAVPVPIATKDGRLFVDGLGVMTYVEGGPPKTQTDWRRVADATPAAPVDTGLAAAPGLAFVDRPAGGGDRDQGCPRRDAARRCR